MYMYILVFPCPLCRKEIDLYAGKLVKRRSHDHSENHHTSARRNNTDSVIPHNNESTNSNDDNNDNIGHSNDNYYQNNMSYIDRFFDSISRQLTYDNLNEVGNGNVDPHTMVNRLSEIFPQYSRAQLENFTRNRFSNSTMSQIIEELLAK